MDFYNVLKIDPMVEILDVSGHPIGNGDKHHYYISGFIDLDESSGINGKFKFKMKDKAFTASYIGTTIPSGTMRLSQLHKIITQIKD